MDPRWHSGAAWITLVVCTLAWVPSGLRWLRVAQREHYLAGSVSRFAARWWRSSPANLVLAGGVLVAAVASLWWPLVGVAAGLGVAAGPLGLSVRGRTAPLAWTRRLRTLAGLWVAAEVLVVAVGVATGLAGPLAVVAALAVPFLVDLACAVTAPLEYRLSAHFVEEAAARLRRVDPQVVAITGSYGKTSTKGHVAHLVRPDRAVVATPASFNNRAGLARAVNEQLAEGTEVFVAEMGTYGPGEIADLCAWCPPDIAAITAIGPVHLERFGTEERIVEAKSEILDRAADVVLAVDDPRLAALADRAGEQGKRVLRCSSRDRQAHVCVERTGDGSRVSAYLGGSLLAGDVEIPTGTQPSNLAIAIAIALVLGVDAEAVAGRLGTLPSVDHRLQAVRSESGLFILDDTYNANPAGAVEALGALVLAGPTGASPPGPSGGTGVARPRMVLVTPGMVELGPRQYDENRRFAAAAAAAVDDVVIVGRTNRRALLAGVAAEPGSEVAVVEVRHRDQAVDWVRAHLAAGDRVLYENDLPDHYP